MRSWSKIDNGVSAGKIRKNRLAGFRFCSYQRAIGRPLSYQATSDEEARARYSRISGSQEETEAHVALWRRYVRRLTATTDSVERILGRKPIALRRWASENVRSFLN